MKSAAIEEAALKAIENFGAPNEIMMNIGVFMEQTGVTEAELKDPKWWEARPNMKPMIEDGVLYGIVVGVKEQK